MLYNFKREYSYLEYNKMKLCNEVWNRGSLESKYDRVYVLFAKGTREQVLLKIQE